MNNLFTNKRLSLFSNGISLELAEVDGIYAGIRQVLCGDTPLRDSSEPMLPYLNAPTGEEFSHYRIVDFTRNSENEYRIKFRMNVRKGDLMEWMVHSIRPRRNPGESLEPPHPANDSSLTWEMEGCERNIGGFRAIGFRYRYRYQSESIPIYKLTDCSSWEPGGKAPGNEFWMRSCFTPSITRFRLPEDFYSSEWYLPSCTNSHPFQFLPLQTELQGFTFTTGPSGTIVTWCPQVAHIRSLFEKKRGEHSIRHFHELCGDLSKHFVTPEIEVLYLPGRRSEHEKLNLYEAVKEMVFETLHQEIGFRRERVTTYGMIEEWGNADFERYTNLGLSKLTQAGMKKIGLANHFENNMNVWGVSNMCCTVDYRIAASVGEDKFQNFCFEAKKHGIKTEMWGNTALSSLSWLFQQKNGNRGRIDFLPEEGSVMEALSKAPDPFVRTPSNALEADHYTPVFAVLNLRDPVVRAHWLKRWEYAAKKLGLAGIFLDSSFNLSSDKFHWIQNPGAQQSEATADQTALLGNSRPAYETEGDILSQYHAHLSLMREMQQIGYDYCNEDLGVFGIHRHGPDIAMRLDSLPLWADCLVAFEEDGIRAAGKEPEEVFFRGLAFRMMWILYWDIEFDCLSFRISGNRENMARPPGEFHLKLFRAYNEVEHLLYHREVLPEDCGVVYRSEKKTVLWAFRKFQINLPFPFSRKELPSEKETTGDTLDVIPFHIYILDLETEITPCQATTPAMSLCEQ